FLTQKSPRSLQKKEPGHLNVKIPSAELKGFCLSSKEYLIFILAPIATEILFCKKRLQWKAGVSLGEQPTFVAPKSAFHRPHSAPGR
ncbi:hypothetical protein, partial [Kaistella sp.]|uniref:hypothetical protein n=1 Tax=Kaistella sp. TaxID=2782235 RepID=UPI002F953530